MKTIVITSRTGWHMLMHLAFATLITVYLFFLGEDYVNFPWMKNLSNWLFFFVFCSLFILGQLLVKRLMLKTYSGILQTLLSCIIGSGLELMMAMILLV